MREQRKRRLLHEKTSRRCVRPWGWKHVVIPVVIPCVASTCACHLGVAYWSYQRNTSTAIAISLHLGGVRNRSRLDATRGSSRALQMSIGVSLPAGARSPECKDLYRNPPRLACLRVFSRRCGPLMFVLSSRHCTKFYVNLRSLVSDRVSFRPVS